MIEHVVRAFRSIAPLRHVSAPGRNIHVGAPDAHDDLARADRVRLHLGRGRRARDAGGFAKGALEARRALREDPNCAWAHALLGQCLARGARPDLTSARRALDRACALDRTNGYFVRSLLEVLDAHGDPAERDRVLATAWWSGAPVERWMNADSHRHVGSERRRPAARRAAPANAAPLPIGRVEVQLA